MQVIILAGGSGVRLRPYTTILPKPLMPIGGKAVLEIILLQLKTAGFNEFVFTVGYLAGLIEAYFGDGRKWGVKIRYSRESCPLGTVGPLTLVNNLAPEFIVMNGDVLCDIDYAGLINEHVVRKNDITISSSFKKVKIDLGVLEIDKNKLINYIEKPELLYRVSMGIYGMNRKLVRNIRKNKYCDFPQLVVSQIKNDAKIGVYQFNGRWYDIGRIEDYQLAQEEYLACPELFIKKGRNK